MKLLIKQRVFSWSDTYDIYDEDGKPKYFVKAELFRLGHQLHVYDSANREIGMVKQRIFTFLPAFDIEIDGQTFGSIEKQFTFFKPKYHLDYNGWRCEGDFLSWDYDVYSGCSVVVHISKEPLHWGDTYGFSHGKGGEDGADTQPFQMPQKEKCHSGGHSQTDYIEGHFNIGIFGVEDFRKFPGKQIRRSDRKSTAIGQRDAETENQVTQDEIKHPAGQCSGQNGNPKFVDIQQLTEGEAYY